MRERVNAEFLRRVEEESECKANEKLEKLRSAEWLGWYKVVVELRILQLESQIRYNAIKTLEGPWIITCDKCGTKFQRALPTEGVEELLRRGSLMIECQNPNCINSILFLPSRHKIKITLKELIELKCVS